MTFLLCYSYHLFLRCFCLPVRQSSTPLSCAMSSGACSDLGYSDDRCWFGIGRSDSSASGGRFHVPSCWADGQIHLRLLTLSAGLRSCLIDGFCVGHLQGRCQEHRQTCLCAHIFHQCSVYGCHCHYGGCCCLGHPCLLREYRQVSHTDHRRLGATLCSYGARLRSLVRHLGRYWRNRGLDLPFLVQLGSPLRCHLH